MTIVEQMLEKYPLKSIEDKKHALKEVMQEIMLAALSKTNFFERAAFYGGTALRIFYGLNRFSEDLDFSLLLSDENFTFEGYVHRIKEIVSSFGFMIDIETKEKSADSNIKSAFLKSNTKEQFLIFYPNSDDISKIAANEKIKIKFEIDINPPKYANTEVKYQLLPFPYQVRIYDLPSLFAGKIHAVIARSWRNRVKGRDLYDYIFYLSKNTSVNLKYLSERLKESQLLSSDETLDRDKLLVLLFSKFDLIDYTEAKRDVFPFIKNTTDLDLWSADFFKEITRNLSVI